MATPPKKPMTAYFLFMKEQRSVVKESNPDMKVSEISKELGKLWAELSDTEKEKFKNLAAEAKLQYDEDLKAYITEHGEPSKKPRNSKKGAKKGSKKSSKTADPTKPKKPLTPFFLFQNSRRQALKEENPDMAHKDIVRKMGEEWNQMTESDKKTFINQNKKLKVAYEKEMKEWTEKKESDKEETREDESDD
ncbi:unnamed protein product [Moneuplotes crassus]|uniref:HMG box domain-containing protein n=1 Tax=Euplotes crassus TaxID=5936 RepID=A0AAD1XV47_EUPCR|nr:unnamed protein product [Moneuplotes crassus]